MMTNVVILQRVVTSYRLPVFRQIHAELGWPVVYGKRVGGLQTRVEPSEPFLYEVEFPVEGR